MHDISPSRILSNTWRSGTVILVCFQCLCLYIKAFTNQRKTSFRTWRWCGLVCTLATTTSWTPAALSTSLQVWTEQISFEHLIYLKTYSLFCTILKPHSLTGEIKGGKVSGFHNWIRFYLLEKSGKLNYYSHSFNGPVSTDDKNPKILF